MDKMNSLVPDCTLKCRSLRHALDVVSVVTRGNEGQIKAFLTSHCYNAATCRDAFGRNALHLAASCGKKGVLEWLAETNGVDLLVKDKESGWTALHRGVFYGHIDCACSLMKHGVSLYIQDKEGLSALDIVMKDRPSYVTFKNTDPTDVYTWGNNINFTLGHSGHQSKHHPELVDYFPRNGIYIKQVVLCEFHSVFLSQKGNVYTCGHGQGGRLGHGDEQTCLIPRLVESLIVHQCSRVAAAKDHTVVLTEDGCVFTFGLNTFHQLGILPPPPNCSVPRQVQAKSLKGRTVTGVAAARFHTVLWTKEAVYTMGLNGGQLGYLLDPNGEKCVSSPRQVSALLHKDITVSFVTASDGATVCVSERGDIYLLTDYQCKKLASKQLNLKKVLVNGGYLEYRVNPQHLKENEGQRICILALDEAGRVFCWKSANSPMKPCRWVCGRQVCVSDISLNKNELMFVTQEGEAFRGKWMEGNKNSEKKEIVANLQNSANDVATNDASSVCERIRLEKLAFVHRAVSITTDPNGCNFAVLQSDPKTSLYEIPSVSLSNFAEDFGKLLMEATVTDTIHDVTFQVGARVFPVHKYLLAMRSDFFRKLFTSDHDWLDPPDLYRKDGDDVGCELFVIEKLHPDLFMYLLQYIYTDSCDLLVYGHMPKMIYKEKKEENEDTLISDFNKITVYEDIDKSAFEVYRSNQAQLVNETQKSKPKSASKKCKDVGEEVNLIKMLQSAAKKFGLGCLSSRLDGVKMKNGRISVVSRKNGNKPKLNQKKLLYLCDVTMKSIDGKEFPCHKCILCARLDYFHSMLSSSWIEASCSAALEMPFPSDILQVILDYIYTDEAIAIKESENVEFICSVLVVADQLLMLRLKEICEVAITEKLTLKNAAKLLEFAAMYNAEQLKQSCFQFIVLNMAAILEIRALDVLSDGVLNDLSVSYRKMIPAMVRRVITPYQDGPDISLLEPEEGETFVFLKEEQSAEQATQEAVLKKAKAKAKKKPRRRSDSSGGYNLSDIIQNPPSTGLLKLDKTNSVESLPEVLTSDSEGSYVGVNSPRDLQSPDFTVGFHTDKVEVKKRMYVSSTVVPRANKEVKVSEGTSLQKKSTPRCIPNNKNTSASSSNWVIGSFSPTSPSAMDLRTIMEVEENMQKCGTMPKINSGPTTQGNKLSQKQRKLIAMTSKDNSPEIMPIAAALPAQRKTTKPGNVWSTSSPSALPTSLPTSFHKLLIKEEKSFGVGTSSRKAWVKELEDAQTAKTRRCTTAADLQAENDHSCEPIQSESPNPWLATSLPSLAAATPITFAEIVKEELQQEAALVRTREKLLALIQIEERAIQDLLIHYRAYGNPDEFVVVERSPQGPIAAPMWNKH
ncbi:inhibitor of Bruton tyrosine kinase isoform X2 [Sphaerodactylus townsendi]|uniref:inhibitor of Bruton tyrosine kinase isoform X2 n=1 Tax=Sphaerodactylus townsendi TaxID=933632 RepID=UPI00202712A2|nr:inhibitor of Bruton tyrosine kinase isoform X2 [Sphaerodactylus townsendi]